MDDIIVEAIKEYGLRIENGNRWLVVHKDHTFIVYEHKPYARHTTTVLETQSKLAAVTALLDT